MKPEMFPFRAEIIARFLNKIIHSDQWKQHLIHPHDHQQRYPHLIFREDQNV